MRRLGSLFFSSPGLRRIVLKKFHVLEEVTVLGWPGLGLFHPCCTGFAPLRPAAFLRAGPTVCQGCREIGPAQAGLAALAPSSRTTFVDFAESSSATCLKRVYSKVVLDMPTESRPVRRPWRDYHHRAAGFRGLLHRPADVLGQLVLPLTVETAVLAFVFGRAQLREWCEVPRHFERRARAWIHSHRPRRGTDHGAAHSDFFLRRDRFAALVFGKIWRALSKSISASSARKDDKGEHQRGERKRYRKAVVLMEAVFSNAGRGLVTGIEDDTSPSVDQVRFQISHDVRDGHGRKAELRKIATSANAPSFSRWRCGRAARSARRRPCI